MSEREFHLSLIQESSIPYPFYAVARSKLMIDYCRPPASEVDEKLTKASAVDSSLVEPGIPRRRTED